MKPPSLPRPQTPQAKKDRLAKALKANLRRRKAASGKDARPA